MLVGVLNAKVLLQVEQPMESFVADLTLVLPFAVATLMRAHRCWIAKRFVAFRTRHCITDMHAVQMALKNGLAKERLVAVGTAEDVVHRAMVAFAVNVEV